jgi:putative ABC transport system permease protein
MLSLHEVIEPLIIRYANPAHQILIRIDAQNIPQTLASMQQTWDAIVGPTALNYRFVDQHFQQQYEKDEKQGRLFAGFSLLTMIIAALGLFGLSSYVANQRTREIGIRKVLGATVGQLSILLVRGYFKLMVIALIIGIPVANYFMSEWLNNFAYRTPVRWWYFAFPAFITLLIALVSVSRQTLRAATVNPADSLKHE